MPYIKQEKREGLEPCLKELIDEISSFTGLTVGEMNYVITRLLHHWVGVCGENYSTYNAAVGILECTKQELLRKHVGPYEEQKRETNGKIGVLD